MLYTMSHGKNEITVDTENGIITGNTYQMKEIIKEDLYATWDANKRAWVSENLEETVEKYKDYLTRCYKLTAKTIVEEKLINGYDGFYELVKYSDGSTKKSFVG